MLAILAVLIFFMFRNGQKRKRDQEALRSKMVVGADVMTNFGLFGTILDIDEENNKVELQAGPGVVLTVHRQTVARVVEADDAVADEDEPADDAGSEPGDSKSDNA
ncbi:preprotein translocase subunit YajC [Paramicrobacterium humi]|nr:preprotein translocase subunit YajC [Microbacterium humi]